MTTAIDDAPATNGEGACTASVSRVTTAVGALMVTLPMITGWAVDRLQPLVAS
jgi:hypothetical protein